MHNDFGPLQPGPSTFTLVRLRDLYSAPDRQKLPPADTPPHSPTTKAQIAASQADAKNALLRAIPSMLNMENHKDPNRTIKLPRRALKDRPSQGASTIGKNNAEQKRLGLDSQCLKLYLSVQDPGDHLTKLTSVFDNELFARSTDGSIPEPLVTKKAYDLLCRLPGTAPDILDALQFEKLELSRYQIHQSGDPSLTPWLSLPVVHYVTDFVLYLALNAAVCHLSDKARRSGRLRSLDYVEKALLLLQKCIEFANEQTHDSAAWTIVCVFVWTSWSRGMMLHLWSSLDGQVFDFDPQATHDLHCKNLKMIQTLFQSRFKDNISMLRRTPYLCNWAFQGLFNHPANLALDLRYFHRLYHCQFGERDAICLPSATQCDGSSSSGCRRFKDSRARNQSMHDYRCTGSCRSLFWNRDSFIGVKGARAIDIDLTNRSSILNYTIVDGETLTVSHVWSHGQGGRPDNVGPEGTGFNECLHHRYADIASSLGCRSYWMDTPCIPSEKELRWECISQITSIFSTSSKTLICDRDIMDIELGATTIQAYERVLATLLVCDWTLRAWTLLESMRGRCGLFVLCRQNAVVSLSQVIRSVYEKGRIDLVTLFLGRDFLFPSPSRPQFRIPANRDFTYIERDKDEETGFIDIGSAASLLSHRHATRDGDDLLIWSLLIGDLEDEDPVAMWKRQYGKRIRTGSLISSAKRIQNHRGLGWAPSSPTAFDYVESQRGHSSRFYPAYDGSNTVEGSVRPGGLSAKWLVREFLTTAASTAKGDRAHGDLQQDLLSEIITLYLGGYKWGALLEPVPTGVPPWTPVPYRGVFGYVFVICGLESEGAKAWDWKGIYEWDMNVPLPQGEISLITIQ